MFNIKRIDRKILKNGWSAISEHYNSIFRSISKEVEENSKKAKLSPNFQRCFMYIWLKGYILFYSKSKKFEDFTSERCLQVQKIKAP